MILDLDYVFEKYKPDVSGIIHIGGHYGNEISKYKDHNVKNIILFEPLSENFSVLEDTIKSIGGNIVAHKVALGNDNKKVIMNISSNEAQSSSILTPKVHLTAHPEVSFIGTEEVQMNKLDDYDCNNCNMMVVDVQGYELEVLKGASETLKNIDYIYCEVNRDEVYEGNARVEEIDEFLSTYGFDRMETQWYYTEVWGDALYVKNKKANVSIICACKNRYEALKIALNSWIMFDEVKEIIIVDWSSDKPIDNLLELDGRIRIIRVDGKKYFNLSQPLNLAASIATGDYILKLDCDYVINPYYNFIKEYKIDQNSFLSGNAEYKNFEYYDDNNELKIDMGSMSVEDILNYVNLYSNYFRYLKGMLFVSKKNFLKVGGFDEDIQSYGWEDGEIIKRLESLNLEHKKLSFDYKIFHIPHPDRKRFEYSEDYSIEDENYFRKVMESQYSPESLPFQIDYALVSHYIEKNKTKLIEEGKLINIHDNISTETYFRERKIQWILEKLDNNYYMANEKTDQIIIDKSKLNYFPSVYYITLEESIDRQKSLEQQFLNYDIQPNAIKSKRFYQSNDKIEGKYIYQLNGGTKGCCVSHLKAIKEWYDTTDEDYAFFCEDDISLETVQYWNFTWEQFIESLPEDAECVQLFTIRDSYDTFDLRERYWDDWGASAYIVTRDYAKKIIDAFIKQDYYLLEVPNQEAMPLIENMLFACLGKTYTIPLFIENTKFNSTFQGSDDDVKDGHKNNHVISRNLVLNHWKLKSICEEKTKEQTEIEKLLTTYALDTENPEHNFNLGLWYENEGHTASALSYYLRCAERSEDTDLAYEALIRGSYCYKKQKERDGSTRSLLWQAQMVRPDRPEAYYLLSVYAEERQWWQDCYVNADLALRYCNFDQKPLRTDVSYPGKYGLLLEKVISGWWWEKHNECRELLQEIKNNHKVKDEHFSIIQKWLLDLSTGYVSDDELKYNKNSNKELKFKFDGWENVENNYSQAGQDLFVLSALNGKRNGFYLEIGAQQPFYQNNTALLETKFDWEGVSIEILSNLCQMFSEQRKNKIICADATNIDYDELLSSFNKGNIVDYLQLDCEPSEVTFNILKLIPFDKYKFRLITYEHDHFVDLSNTYRSKSREYLESKGYKMLVSNVSPNDKCSFEDWWYHPDLIDSEVIENMLNISDITDVRSYLYLN